MTSQNTTPPGCQIRARREAHGISTTQFAYRLGVNQSTAIRLEQSEARKAISLLSLERAAHALDCDLEYKLIPRGNPKQTNKKSERQRSELSNEMSSRIIEDAQKMSPENRLRRAFELSDFAWKLHKCSKR